MGDQKIPWDSNLNPDATLGNLSNFNVCPKLGQCVAGDAAWTGSAGYIAPAPSDTAASPVPAKITVSASGTYGSHLTLMVEAIQATAGGLLTKDLSQRWESSLRGVSKRSSFKAEENHEKRDVVPTETTMTGTWISIPCRAPSALATTRPQTA